MTHEPFTEVVLRKDIPEKGLKKGDAPTVVERHAAAAGEDGYSLEIFNALGDTMAVVTVPQSMIEPLTKDKVFTVREVGTG